MKKDYETQNQSVKIRQKLKPFLTFIAFSFEKYGCIFEIYCNTTTYETHYPA